MAKRKTPKDKTYWINKNDDLAREINRLRAGNKCERCSKDGNFWQVHWAHIFGRETKSMRWLEENALLLCAQCHIWNHDYPTEYAEWFNSKWPGRKKKLQNLYNQNRPLTIQFYQAENERLKVRLDSFSNIRVSSQS